MLHGRGDNRDGPWRRKDSLTKMFYFDPWLIIAVLPAVLLGLYAQMRVRTTFAEASKMPASLTGAEAARRILNSHGLFSVQVEEVGGMLSDHFDPRANVIRLSSAVYRQPSLASVGIAAHEVGHALQHATGYAAMGLRNAAFGAARFGSPLGLLFILLGAGLGLRGLLIPGMILFGTTALFQLINLPVEFNASTRAKDELESLGIVRASEMPAIRRILNAAALTYLAATLESVLTLAYYAMQFMGSGSSEEA